MSNGFLLTDQSISTSGFQSGLIRDGKYAFHRGNAASSLGVHPGHKRIVIFARRSADAKAGHGSGDRSSAQEHAHAAAMKVSNHLPHAGDTSGHRADEVELVAIVDSHVRIRRPDQYRINTTVSFIKVIEIRSTV